MHPSPFTVSAKQHLSSLRAERKSKVFGEAALLGFSHPLSKE